MGNRMNWADRVAAGPDLEWRLKREVALLDIEHPDGFAVRLHMLGDFYSVAYVNLWCALLQRHTALHVWGYTARHDKNDPIAAALLSLTRSQKRRAASSFASTSTAKEAISLRIARSKASASRKRP